MNAENIVVFEDCEDPEELLELTWAALQTVRYPVFRIKGTFIDLECVWGYSHEAVRIGDDVQVLVREWNIAYQDFVENVVRDYIDPLNTQVTIGPEGATSYSIQTKLSSQIETIRERADMGATMAVNNPTLLQGIIDTIRREQHGCTIRLCHLRPNREEHPPDGRRRHDDDLPEDHRGDTQS